MRIDWTQYQPTSFYDELFAAAGKARPAAAELADYLSSLGARALAERQNEDGSWVNKKNNRWLEADANLVTGYALLVLSHCK